MYLEGMEVNQQEKRATKQRAMQKIHVSDLHPKVGNTREDSMCETANHLHCSDKGNLEVFKDCSTAKSNHTFLHKVEEDQYLNLGKIIYLDIISQNKPTYGGSNNWILIQDPDTDQTWYFS